MATHSRTIAWKIPWTEEPSRLQSMGSQRVGHDWATSLHFRRETKKGKVKFKLKNVDTCWNWLMGISGFIILFVCRFGNFLNIMRNNKLWKTLQEMGIPDCLTWLLRNLYADQEATVRTGHGEKEMTIHSSVLAWRIPGTGEPCGLPSMGSHRVGHDWSHLAAAAKVMEAWVLQSMGSQRVGHNWVQQQQIGTIL